MSDLGAGRRSSVGGPVCLLHLVFNEGYSVNVDLVAEAIRLTYRTPRRDSSGISGCMVSSSDLSGDHSGGRGGGDRGDPGRADFGADRDLGHRGSLARFRTWIDSHSDQLIFAGSPIVGLWLIGKSIYLIVN